MITDQEIAEFQRIYEKEYGVKMDREEVIESASNLIQYLEIALPVAYRIKQNNAKEYKAQMAEIDRRD